MCDKIRYYDDGAFRKRGLLRTRYGTGRPRGLGIGSLLGGLLMLALACLVTLLVACLCPE